jgi:hypothetical protein
MTAGGSRIVAEVTVMAFLDFVKSRQQSQSPEQSQPSKPETAKEMYSREASQSTASAKSMQQMPPEQQAKVTEISGKLQQATQHMGQHTETPSAAPQDSASSPQPMAQKMTSQDKAAPNLSPTSMQAGTRSTEQDAPASSESSSRTESKSAQQTQKTMARTPPSWER